jgi:hypothetical protein
MKLFSVFRYAATFAFFLLLAAPAFAQFEVSPDHFDENTSTPRKAVSTKKSAGQINSNRKSAVANTTASTATTVARVHHAGKASPGSKSANTVVAATAGTPKGRPQQALGTSSSTVAPKLKAQASPVHRE